LMKNLLLWQRSRRKPNHDRRESGGGENCVCYRRRPRGWLCVGTFARLRTHKLRPQRSGFLWSPR
jgi:hypothetical protein